MNSEIWLLNLCGRKHALLSNYVTQLGEGGGKPLCYDMILIVSKMVNLVLQRGEGGGQKCFEIVLRNL